MAFIWFLLAVFVIIGLLVWLLITVFIIVYISFWANTFQFSFRYHFKCSFILVIVAINEDLKVFVLVFISKNNTAVV